MSSSLQRTDRYAYALVLTGAAAAGAPSRSRTTFQGDRVLSTLCPRSVDTGARNKLSPASVFVLSILYF